MPKVNNRHYPYTPEGIKKAEKAKKKSNVLSLALSMLKGRLTSKR